jgi:hypothetical protein
VAATRRTAGVEEVQTGYSAIGDAAGTASTFSMVSAVGVVPAGYVRAVEHITIANDDGHVLWLSDDLVPAACGPKAVGSCLPVAVLLLPGGAFWHFGSAGLSAARGSCWGTLSDAAVDGYTQTGAAYGYDLYGRFSPMHRVGGSELVTSIFPWGTAQTATEVDTVPVTTHLPTLGAVHISATPGHPGFSYRWTNHWLTRALPVPRVTLCDG